MSADWPVLSMTIWLPIVGGLMVLGSGDKSPNTTRWLALILSVATFLVSLPLWFGAVVVSCSSSSLPRPGKTRNSRVGCKGGAGEPDAAGRGFLPSWR